MPVFTVSISVDRQAIWHVLSVTVWRVVCEIRCETQHSSSSRLAGGPLIMLVPARS